MHGARGGWGLVIAEATYIDVAYSQGYNNQPGIAYGEQQASWGFHMRAPR